MTYTLADAERDWPSWFSSGAFRFFGAKLHEHEELAHAVYVVHFTQFDSTTPRQYFVTRFSATQCDMLCPIYGLRTRLIAKQRMGHLAIAEGRGLIHDRLDSHKMYIPCVTCSGLGREHPLWASYLYAQPRRGSASPALDLCAEHLGEIVEPTDDAQAFYAGQKFDRDQQRGAPDGL
jgi:hypothetical protein